MQHQQTLSIWYSPGYTRNAVQLTLIHTFTFFLISFLLLLRQEESLLYKDHQPDNKEIISISVPFPIINEM